LSIKKSNSFIGNARPMSLLSVSPFIPFRPVLFFLLWLGLTAGNSRPAEAASGSGTTAFSFVRIVPGARQAALGGASTGVSGDVNGMVWNPAGIGFIEKSQVSMTYAAYFIDIQYGVIGYARPLGSRHTAGVAIQYLSYGTLRETTVDDQTGNGTGSFSAGDFALTLSYSRRFASYISAGINVKTLYERIHQFSMDALAVDMGVQAHIPWRRMSVGVTFHHIGAVRSGLVSGERPPLPTGARMGVGYVPEHLPVLLVAEMEKNREQSLLGRIGWEFNIRDRVFLRGGYATSGSDLRIEKSDFRLSGLTGGIGIHAAAFRLDYALTPVPRLGAVHRVSVTWAID
jgi:hypothetical protein